MSSTDLFLSHSNPFISKINNRRDFDPANIINEKDEALRPMDDFENEDEETETADAIDSSLLIIISNRTDNSQIINPSLFLDYQLNFYQ